MGHTPFARYIYLGFDSEVSCGCVNQYRVANFKRLHQKRLSNVYMLAKGNLSAIISMEIRSLNQLIINNNKEIK